MCLAAASIKRISISFKVSDGDLRFDIEKCGDLPKARGDNHLHQVAQPSLPHSLEVSQWQLTQEKEGSASTGKIGALLWNLESNQPCDKEKAVYLI